MAINQMSTNRHDEERIYSLRARKKGIQRPSNSYRVFSVSSRPSFTFLNFFPKNNQFRLVLHFNFLDFFKIADPIIRIIDFGHLLRNEFEIASENDCTRNGDVVFYRCRFRIGHKVLGEWTGSNATDGMAVMGTISMQHRL